MLLSAKNFCFVYLRHSFPAGLLEIQKMPRKKANNAAAKPVEPVKPAEPEEMAEVDEPEDTMEEEVEYEEVEEEVEEEVVEEVEEEEEETTTANGDDAIENQGGDNEMNFQDNDESEKNAELLALPPHGSEVYVGGIPDDAHEEDVKGFCESVGEVVEVRMLKSSDDKIYAFVTYRTKELATKAIKDLNNTELKGKKIKCSTCQAKNRLFIGNVPRNWVEDDMRKAVTKIGPGVTGVTLMKDPQNSSRNRGYAFIEYYNHACAEHSRKKMSTPEFKLDDNAPTVSWADPRSADSASTAQVKAIYVKNLPKNITQDQLKKLFQHHGEITRVVLPPAKSGQENRIGFVHFAERATAMKALKNTEKYEIDGRVLECSLAKPPADNKGDTKSSAQRGPLLPNYQPGVIGSPYGVLPAGFAQPMMYGGGAPGVAMVPTVLPDGRLAYIVQQPGAAAPKSQSQQRGGGWSGNSSGGRKSSDESSWRRYQPY